MCSNAAGRRLKFPCNRIESPHLRTSWDSMQRLTPLLRRRWPDILIMALLALAAGGAALALQQRFNPVIYQETTFDAWFDADIPRIFLNLTDRLSDHSRADVHPLFSLLAYPPARLLALLPGVEQVDAVHLLVSATAALWAGLLYLLMRLITGRPLDGLIFALAGLTSASAIFWLTVPEVYALSSVTIMAALIVAAALQRGLLRGETGAVVAGVLTLSVLITNWMVGLLLAFLNFPWRRALQISLNALVIVVLLWSVQKLLFPNAEFFLGSFGGEERFLLTERSGGPLAVSRSFFLHTIAMPQPEQITRHQGIPPFPTLMTTQPAALGSGGLSGVTALLLWLPLLLFGALGMITLRAYRRLALLLALLLAGQLALHILYGDETFLYSLNFLPVLLSVAAMGALTRWRPLALALAGLLALTAGLNNLPQFRQAAAFFDAPLVVQTAQPPTLPIPGDEAGRERVLAAMRERPADPWPRGSGHVVLAIPGSPEIEKGYHEPGGSFSPAAGSFGLSIWALDQAGQILATSDSLPLADVPARLVWPEGAMWPGIETTTPYYTAAWHPLAPGEWQLRLTPAADFEGQLALLVRGVGPAGGPINRLEFADGALRVNDQWRLTPSVPPEVRLGHEGDPGWMDAGTGEPAWQGDDGWGYARLTLPAGEALTVDVARQEPPFVAGPAAPPAGRGLNLQLPDAEFVASLDAQAAHLLMSLVGNETRPGDPLNYPLTWQRDAAYIIVALARAGHVEQATALADYLAEHDFFGGFGAEADAPGLAIWALNELALIRDDPAFTERMWPHIARKAGLIEQMLAAERPLYQPFSGPVVPALAGNSDAGRVADAARDGLIVGRMDHHRPLLYVNAVSYRGLRDAAEFAGRLGHDVEAARWQSAAIFLQEAWREALDSPEAGNERTYISGLWPSWIAGDVGADAYQGNLEGRWAARRTPEGGFLERPLWTYFEVGEAHQWLYLERPDRVWATLRWSWDNQVSPGLFTWWEGAGEENSARQWEKVRGWVAPPYVTPHYWTTAEMLLLQLEMLAYARPDGAIVIGAGVPEHWLDGPLSVGPLPTALGPVSWSWDGERLSVDAPAGVEVVRGPAFAGR